PDHGRWAVPGRDPHLVDAGEVPRGPAPQGRHPAQMTRAPAPTVRDIWLARARIRGLARRTTLLRAPELGPDVWIADETRQPTGAFKIRGAANALLSLSPELRARGVVAVSTGNHGRAVAYVARELGIPATV